jgi:hypothetical protein
MFGGQDLRSHRDYLFTRDDLDNQLRSKHAQTASAVDGISEAQFLASSDEQILEFVIASSVVHPIQLHEDQARLEQKEARVDVSGDPRRMFFNDERGPFFVPGTGVTVSIPFTGAGWIWECRTNPYDLNPPTGQITATSGSQSGLFIFQMQLAHDEPPEQLKQRYDATMASVRICIERSTNQVETYNNSLEGVVRNAITARRARLEKHRGISAILNIPIRPKADAPSLQRIPIQLKYPPALPVPPKTGLQPEPGIDADTYEKILNIIRHEGRTFETAPGTFAKHDEEELRDIILAHLNGHFEGGATGETFRRAGKTDIRIEEKNRAAFVAECKVWRGAGEIERAIDQLLTYLTWRDGKTALVIFNKDVAGLTDLLPRLRDALISHRFSVGESKVNQLGEVRQIMRTAEDEGRRITVHAFLFNLYTSKAR